VDSTLRFSYGLIFYVNGLVFIVTGLVNTIYGLVFIVMDICLGGDFNV
jgi:hypothetical protein